MSSSPNPELVVLQETCRALTRLRDEAAARSLAELVVRRYANLTRAGDDEAKRSFFGFLVREFAPDPTALADAVTAYQAAPDASTARELWAAAEGGDRRSLQKLRRYCQADVEALIQLAPRVFRRLAS